MDTFNNTTTQNQEMGWDDAIENDGQDYVLLDEGDYNFIVTAFERGRYPGSEKISACNKATLTLSVDTDKGRANVKTDLILFRTLEWKLSSFFRCIGQKKHGERLVMDWSKVLGAEGRAHFRPKEYVDKWNIAKKVNDVAYFIDPDQADTTENNSKPIPF